MPFRRDQRDHLTSTRVSVIAAVLGFMGSGLGCLIAQDTFRQYLSGHGKDDPVPWRFLCTAGRQSGYWTNLPVPSNWELHGFGTLSYRKDATNAWDEKGRYELGFELPARDSGRRAFLVFEGVMTDTCASLNGVSVGPVHQGGFYRFKYEVTKLVRFGATNRLEVTVSKHSANDSVNRAERTADYWVFGGIYRPVYLETMPAQFIERVAIDARADGGITMDVFADGITGTDTEITLEARISETSGKPVGSPVTSKIVGRQATLKTQVAAPRPWTAETPNLYLLEVRLKRRDEVLHRCRQRFGFRTMEVREGDGLYVNGRRVVLKGVNRHSFWPDSGRCLSEAVHRLDIGTIKDMNMNAVRMSHYPPDAQFLDLCDELGLYVLAELAGWHACYDTEVGRKLVEQMATQEVNHPSILFWDNGNEGGGNTNLDGLFARFDPQQRRVLHPWTVFSGVNTSHYLAYDRAVAACEGMATYYRDNREIVDTNDPARHIYMPTEFLHGLYDGGAGAGLEDYWRLMQGSKYLGGGFIWALLDEGVKRPDTGQIDVARNQAPDGVVGPYRQKEASFFAIKDIWSPIIIRERTLSPEFSGTLTLENHYSFTGAAQCSFGWQLRKFRRPDEEAAGFRVLAEGEAAAPSIPPGEIGALQLRLPATWRGADALALCARDPTGRELWTWVWPLPGLTNPAPTRAAASVAEPVQFAETPGALVVKSGDLTARFDTRSGRLAEVRRREQRFSLGNGPRPASGSAELVRLDHTMEGPDALITGTFSGDLTHVRWRVQANGWVRCDYGYTARGAKEFHGVAFDYPEGQVKQKKWLGLGPYRVWKNRMRGATLNVWKNEYNNTITGWADWIYPEFKGCFAGVRWLQLQTAEGQITAVINKGDPFVQVLRPEQPPVKLRGQTDVSLPEAGLAFLHAIPPIGTKFKPADQGGPQGRLAEAGGEYSGWVSFYFGDFR